jgi:hypothetical protein
MSGRDRSTSERARTVPGQRAGFGRYWRQSSPETFMAADPAPAAVDARIKGAGILPYVRWYAQRWGPERLTRMSDGIPAAYRHHFDLPDPHLGVLPSVWYPAPAIHGLLDRMLAEHPLSEHEMLAREGARAIIDATLTGVYRWLFETMMTPDRYARNAQKLFSRYHEPGVMTKTPLGGAGHLSVVRDWTGHHPLLCDFLIHTADYVYHALGCQDLLIRRTSCVSQGGPDCRFEITWRG